MTHGCKLPMSSSAHAVAALAVAALASIATPAEATDPSGFVGTQLAKGNYGNIDLVAKTATFDLKLKTKGDSDIYVTRNAIDPGGYSGWHTHPGPSLITVTVGEITVYDGDNPVCPSTVYHAGDGSFDLGGGHVHLIKNETSAPAETVAVQFVGDGEVRRIDMPKPTNCNF
jgi:quercetin dioxygenase-like cupin family protein